jgi:hypothetical protein
MTMQIEESCQEKVELSPEMPQIVSSFPQLPDPTLEQHWFSALLRPTLLILHIVPLLLQ